MEITTPRRALSIPSRVIGENQLLYVLSVALGLRIFHTLYRGINLP